MERATRRRIRLPPELYREAGSICSITTAVERRQPVFSAPDVALAAVTVIKERATHHNVPVYAYCVMPDHVHLVLSASSTCDLGTFVGQFKNLAQREAWRLGVQGAFWQRSFWDHFLRADEELETVVTYVLNNFVRAGLVETWEEYPYSGSLVFDLS